MTLELIKCPHCEYKYRTDLEKIKKDGKTNLVRGLGLSDFEKILGRKKLKSIYLDLKCPICKKEFEWEVKA